ncbi:MAG: hypothetical protein RLZZ262_2529 [Bacteroidota bacterium]|jgi:hypothetical protein
MAHSEGHSSTERTILWIIIPATLLVSGYFTYQSKKHDKIAAKTELNGDISGVIKKEEVAPVKMETMATDTLHKDTVDAHGAKPAEVMVKEVQGHSAGH